MYTIGDLKALLLDLEENFTGEELDNLPLCFETIDEYGEKVVAIPSTKETFVYEVKMPDGEYCDALILIPEYIEYEQKIEPINLN